MPRVTGETRGAIANRGPHRARHANAHRRAANRVATGPMPGRTAAISTPWGSLCRPTGPKAFRHGSTAIGKPATAPKALTRAGGHRACRSGSRSSRVRSDGGGKHRDSVPQAIPEQPPHPGGSLSGGPNLCKGVHRARVATPRKSLVPVQRRPTACPRDGHRAEEPAMPIPGRVAASLAHVRNVAADVHRRRDFRSTNPSAPITNATTLPHEAGSISGTPSGPGEYKTS